MAKDGIASDAVGEATRDLSKVVTEALSHVSHLLPDQAPIRVFIHHNTLHAFQHLHFHDAVRCAQEVYGAEPYLSEVRYRELMAAGRISDEDVVAALHDQLPGGETRLLAGSTSLNTVRLTMLRHAIASESAATLAWLREERGVTEKLRADVAPAVREHVVSEGRRYLEELLEPHVEDGVLELGRLVSGEWNAKDVRDTLAGRHGASLDRAGLQRAIADDPESFAVSALYHACVALTRRYRPTGSSRRGEHVLLHRDLLAARTGEDAHDESIPVLLRLAAAYLDEGLSTWTMPGREAGFYLAVRKLAAEGSAQPTRWHEIARREFQAQLARRDSPMEVVVEALEELGVQIDEADAYVQTLLLTLPGWAGMFSRLERHPDDRREGAPAASLLDFLAVWLTYERAALREMARAAGTSPREVWRARAQRTRPAHEPPAAAAYRLFQLLQLMGVGLPALSQLTSRDALEVLRVMDEFDELWRRRIFQEAYERHYRLQILDALAAHRMTESVARSSARPPAQFICCFDEREESFRRHLEEVAPACQTFGAPGFFGAAIRFRALDEHQHVPLAPVVIKPTHHIDERPRESDAGKHAARRQRRRLLARLHEHLHHGSRSLWRGTVLNAAFGLLAAVPLIVRIASPRTAGRIRRWASSLVLPSPRTELTVHHDEASDAAVARGFKVDERVGRVATVLESIGLIDGFGELIVLLGHGSTTLNNPHKSAYDCGACGGRQGGPNARVFAHMANDPVVRSGLRERGIEIPEDTWFIGGQHDTCSDGVTLFDLDRLPESHRGNFLEVERTLDAARARTAQERCRRLFSAPRDPTPEQALAHVEGRAEHLAQPRPEFGHATNAVAIVGRRGLTRGLFLDRRAFVLSYDPTIDADGRILERTLAAATPVGAGINLEYYFSHVDNERYGAGSKLPHNVTGMIGVMSGHASDLRTGLPRQMIEIHEPVRLLIIVEATPERLLEIAGRQAEVREFVVNRWVQLVACDPETGALSVLTDRGFEPYVPRPVTLPEVSASRDFYRGNTGFLPPARIVARGMRAA